MDLERGIDRELEEILIDTIDENIKLRQKAEEKLKKLAEKNLGELLLTLTGSISNTDIKKDLREICGNVVQNLINHPKYSESYLQLKPKIKTKIKERILSNYDSNEQNLRVYAALAISGISKIEIIHNQYFDIFDILYENISNKNINYQLTSILTLSLIFKDNRNIILMKEYTNKILNSYYLILNGDENNNQLITETLKSIKIFLPYMTDYFNETGSYNYFFNLIHKQINNKSVDIRNSALCIFLKLIKHYYNYFKCYMDLIFDFTYNIVENDVAKNKILCMEIWINIGKREQNLFLNKKDCDSFLKKYYKPLTEVCLKYIVTYDIDNSDSSSDNDSENNNKDHSLFNKSYQLIKYMSKCCDFNFIEKMLNYFYNNSNSKDIHIQYSAFGVFKAILETKHKNKLYPFICKNLTYIYNLINNSQIQSYLQKLCMTFFRSFCYYYNKEIVQDTQIYDQLMNYFLVLIKTSPKIIIYITIGSINNLCKGIIYNENNMSNPLSKYISDLIEPLISYSSNIFLYDNKINIPIISFKCIGTLAEKVPKDARIPMISTFRTIIEMFHTTMNKKKFNDDRIRLIFQEKIALCLSCFFKSGSVDKKGINLIFQNIIKSIKQRGNLYEEVLKLVGTIALFIKSDFNNLFPQFKDFLIQGINSFTKFSICNSSIICLSDIIHGMGKEFSNYISDFLPKIINIIGENECDIYLKPKCLNIISDIFVFCPKEALKSFDVVMQIIGAGIQALQVSGECKIKEVQNYFNELRDHLIDTLSCVFGVIQEINKTDDFLPYVKPVINFIKFICDDINVISIDVNKSCIRLIVDFWRCYGNLIRGCMNFKLIKILIGKLEERKDEVNSEDYQELQNFIDWAQKQLNKIIID